MSTRKAADPAMAVYLEHLTIQLRLLEVPGGQIGQILAEVETHAADTGLDPVEAFGGPGEYAARYVAVAASPLERGGSRNWLRDLGVCSVAVPSGGAVFEGAMNLAGSVDLTVRLLGENLATVVVGLFVCHLCFALLARDTAGAAKSRTFTSRYAVLFSLAWISAVAVLALIPVLLATGPTLVSVPGWMLFVAGVLAFFALIRHLGGDRVVDPRG